MPHLNHSYAGCFGRYLVEAPNLQLDLPRPTIVWMTMANSPFPISMPGSMASSRRCPTKNLYVKSVAITSGVNVAATVSLKSGEKLTGLTVVIAEGAAGLQ